MHTTAREAARVGDLLVQLVMATLRTAPASAPACEPALHRRVLPYRWALRAHLYGVHSSYGILAVLLGPLGMAYSTILGAIIMFVVTLVVGVLTLGLGLIVTNPICAVWAASPGNS